MGGERPIEILLVEDNPGDARLLREIIKGGKGSVSLRVVGDGFEAMELLRGGDGPFPDLILLDLNLPRKNGLEFLAEMKGEDDLKRIPVVVLTGSEAEEDIRRAYELHASCYIVKPPNLDGIVRIVNGILEFWSGVARLPGGERGGRGS